MKNNLVDSGIEWAPKIPIDWSVVRFKDVYSSKKEIAGDKADSFERLALTLNGVIKRPKDDNGGLQPKDFVSYQILRANDLVFKMIDLQNISTSRVGCSSFDGLVSPAYLRYEPKNSSNKYFYYYFMSLYHNTVFNRIAGDGVRSTLNASDMDNIKCPCPSAVIQQKIANYLETNLLKLDSLINEQEKQIEKLDLYKTQFISSVVYGKELNKCVKSRLDEFEVSIPNSWKVVPLKQLFNFGKGLPITKENLSESGINVISYGQIHAKSNLSFEINNDLFRFVSEKYLFQNPECLVGNGDFIFADTSEDVKGTCDFVLNDSSEKVFAGYHTIVLFKKGDFDSTYLSFQFLTDEWRNFSRKRVGGVKLFSLTKRILSQASVVLPSIDYQLSSSKLLKDKCLKIEKIKQIKVKKMELLEQYKKSMIYEYVTGKKRVEGSCNE